MSSGAYDERVRLASIISDARKALAEPPLASINVDRWAARCGQMEALVKMLADSAEHVMKAGE